MTEVRETRWRSRMNDRFVSTSSWTPSAKNAFPLSSLMFRSDGLRGAAVAHDRGARDQVEVADERQVRQHVLVDPVGKERVSLVLAHVLEREDRDRLRVDGLRRGLGLGGGCHRRGAP